MVVGTYLFLFPGPRRTNGGWCVHDAAGMSARAGEDGESGRRWRGWSRARARMHMGERDDGKETVSSADVHVQKRILLFTMV